MSLQSQSSAGDDLHEILQQIKNREPDAYDESISRDATRRLLKGMTFTDKQWTEEFPCSQRRRGRPDVVDFAASRLSKQFYLEKKDPTLLTEVKKPSVGLEDGSDKYFSTVDQLKRYMRADSCKSVEYGIIFNIIQVQVFRKHVKLVYPVTEVINLKRLSAVQINSVVQRLKKIIIDEPSKNDKPRGTIITIWNNKGGVGKTTTAINLSILLASKIRDPYADSRKPEHNKVLVIDFDHNQADLTKSLCFQKSNGKLKNILNLSETDQITNADLQTLPESYERPQSKYPGPFKIDVITADMSFREKEFDYANAFNERSLPLRTLSLRYVELYDYIIIDAPPNYQGNIYSREAVTAADCLLPIGSFLCSNSIKNYCSVIEEILPLAQRQRLEQECRREGGPHDLGIWFNKWEGNSIGWRALSSQEKEMQEAVRRSIECVEKIYKKRISRGFYDYNKDPNGMQLRQIRKIANISKSFLKDSEPAIMRFKRVSEAYEPLLAEFI